MYERIRNLRVDNDMTQAEVAGCLHIHQTTYSDYELGRLNIPAAALIALARLYGTSVDYLLGLTDVLKPYPPGKRKS